MRGIRLGKELRRRGQQGLIVYVTAYMDYVLTGYEVGAFRYLPKDRLDQMLPKVLEDIRRELSDSGYVFRTGGEVVRVDRRKILYLESRIRQLHLVAEDGAYDYYGSMVWYRKKRLTQLQLEYAAGQRQERAGYLRQVEDQYQHTRELWHDLKNHITLLHMLL